MTSKVMKLEAALRPDGNAGTDEVVRQARELEALGFDRIFTAETSRNPFFPLVLAAANTTRIELGTGIVVAFARSPMSVAASAQDLHLMSNGRFRLGLGSQIKPHITRRFSMPWHGAAKQMREFVESVRAIWDTWYDGTPLNYQGDFYQHTLMTPEFSPQTGGLERPPILLAAVGPLMTKTAAQVADGIIVHPFCTEDYLKNVILPRVEPELASRGKTLDDFAIQYPMFIVTGDTEEQIEKSKAATKYRIGFYGSTPAYKPVLDAHGWGDLQPVLRALTKDNRWAELGDQISDEMLETFAAVGEPAEAARIVKERVGDVADSVVLDASLSADALQTQMSVLRG